MRFYRNQEECSGREVVIRHTHCGGGLCLQPPADPGGNGVVFAGWHDWNDYAADFSQPIEENRDYYAAWGIDMGIAGNTANVYGADRGTGS